MELAVRRARAVEMYVLENKTYAEIGAELGVTAFTVARDMEASLADLNALRLQDINARRLVELARTERVDRKLLPGLDSNDPRVRAATADALRANAEFRAKLDGLHAKADDGWTSAQVTEFVLGFTRELLSEFADVDAKRRIHRVYARRASTALPEMAVEAEVVSVDAAGAAGGGTDASEEEALTS